MNQNKSVNIVLIVVIVVLVGAVTYFALSRSSASPATPVTTNDQVTTPVINQVPATQAPTTPTSKPTAVNWKTYVNTQYGFSFQYPSDKYVAPDNSNITKVYSGSVTIGLLKVGTGQSKFLEMEVWDSQSALNANSSYIAQNNPVVIMIGNRPVTFWDKSQEVDARQIISTFKFQ